MPNEELEKQVEQYEQDLKSGKKKSKKGIIKYVLNISLVLIATVVAIFLSVYSDFDAIIANLAKCNYKWILLIIGIMLIISLTRGLILFCFVRLYTKSYRLHQGIAIDQIGIFYNAVTPGATGGQIMQAYAFKKQGVQISSAVSIMAMYSIVYQSVLIIYGIISFIFKYDFINAIGEVPFAIAEWKFSIPIWPLTIIGFVLNLSVILIVLLMSYWHGFHNFIMGPCISLLAKIKIIKKPDRSRENLRIQVENFKIELRRLLTNIPFMILVALLFAFEMTLRFSVPYFLGLALGNQSTVASFWDSVFLSNYHQMVTGLIPIPGAAGVSEYFFAKLFYNADNPVLGFYYAGAGQASYSMTMAALLLWRSITFTFPLLVAGIVTAFYKSGPKEMAQKENMPSRQTFVELQRETYLDRKAEVETLLETQRLTQDAIKKRLKVLNRKEREEKKKEEEKIKNQPINRDFDNVNIEDSEDDSI